MLPGLLLTTLGLLLMARLDEHSAYFPTMFFALLILGLGAGLAFIPLLAIAMANVPSADAGLASGIVNVSLQMSGALGLAVLGTISTTRARSLFTDGHALPTALTGGYQLAFLVGAALVGLGAVLAFVLLRTPPPVPASEPAARPCAPGRRRVLDSGLDRFADRRRGDHHARPSTRREITMAVPPMPGLWNWPNPTPDFEFSRDALEGVEGPEGPDYAGYKVVANDGEIGHVDSFAIAPDEGHIVVDTGHWLFGRMSLVPAGAVRVVDHDSQTVQIDLTKQQIKDAPEYDRSAGYDAYRDPATEYYGPMM